MTARQIDGNSAKIEGKLNDSIFEIIDNKIVEHNGKTEYMHCNIPKKPEYNKCNKGHTLKLVYNYNKDQINYDCPKCIEKYWLNGGN